MRMLHLPLKKKEEASEIIQTLMKVAPKEKLDTFIPSILDMRLDEFHESYPDWLKYRITGSLPVGGGFREQPEHLMDNILYIDSIYEKVCNQINEQTAKKGRQ